MTLELPPCECCDQKADRVVPLESGVGFLSLALCGRHFAAYQRIEQAPQKPGRRTVLDARERVQ